MSLSVTLEVSLFWKTSIFSFMRGKGLVSLVQMVVARYGIHLAAIFSSNDVYVPVGEIKKVKEEKDFRSVRQQVGLLFQDADDQLFSPTVLEDVAFGPLNQGKSVTEAKDIARGTLCSLGLEGFEDRITYKLSGGEKRLVSLATVLAMRPKILLLDEPTSGLDPETTQKIIQVLDEIDLSYIFISHNMDFINRMTDKIYGMAHGKIFLEKEKVAHTHVHSHGYGRLPHIHSPNHNHLADSKKR